MKRKNLMSWIVLLMILSFATACGDGNNNLFTDGDEITDGDQENPFGDGDKTEVDQTTDGDSDAEEDRDIEIEEITDGDEAENADEDELPVPCSIVRTMDYLAMEYVCGGMSVVITDIETPQYKPYNGISVEVDIEDCACVLLRPACDNFNENQVGACGIRALAVDPYEPYVDQDGTYFNEVPIDIQRFFIAENRFTPAYADAEFNLQPMEFSISMVNEVPGTLINDLFTAVFKSTRSDEFQPYPIIYLLDHPVEILDETIATVDQENQVASFTVVAWDEVKLDESSLLLNIRFEDMEGNELSLFLDEEGKFSGAFEPGEHEIKIIISPDNVAVEDEKSDEKVLRFTVDEPDPCEDFACQSNAHCEVGENDIPDCTCDSGYHFGADGITCTTNLCDPNPCDATSQVCSGGQCSCAENYVGDDCHRDWCADNTCTNGSCINEVCDCRDTGFAGTLCDEDINECNDSGTCSTGYTCVNNDGSFACENTDECTATPNICGEGYTCRDTDGSHACDDINECTTPDICGSGYTCHNEAGSYTCDDTDGCTPINACVNGECVDTPAPATDYSCHCDLGWDGTFCDECAEGYGGVNCDPVPTISDLDIECDWWEGDEYCWAGHNFPLTWNYTNTTSFTTSLEKLSGCTPTNGNVSPESGVLNQNGSKTVDYTLGLCSPSVVRLTVTVIGFGGSASSYIDITYW